MPYAFQGLEHIDGFTTDPETVLIASENLGAAALDEANDTRVTRNADTVGKRARRVLPRYLLNGSAE